MNAQTFGWCVAGATAVWGLAQIVRYSNRHTRRIDDYIQDLEERAHTCKPEAVEDVLIEAIGYGHTNLSMRQQMRLISTMHFLMGRKKEQTDGRTNEARARTQGTAAPPPDQSAN